MREIGFLEAWFMNLRIFGIDAGYVEPLEKGGKAWIDFIEIPCIRLKQVYDHFGIRGLLVPLSIQLYFNTLMLAVVVK